jgi:ATP-dependent RNA helicase RhlE
MLDMGFLPALKKIISKLPEDRQSLFFSATMPPNIVELSEQLLFDPVQVNVTPKSSSVQKIDQQIVMVEKGGKQGLLQDLLSNSDVSRAIVFTRTKRGANVVAEKLEKKGIASAAIHGNKSQGARQRALDAFKSNDIRVLVATDLAARGIDVDGISHVINFDMPTEPESYVHRIGRTGRAGATGIAISFCSSAERSELRAIQDLIGKKIPLSNIQPSSQTDEPRSSGRNDSTGAKTHSEPNRQPSRKASSQRPATRKPPMRPTSMPVDRKRSDRQLQGVGSAHSPASKLQVAVQSTVNQEKFGEAARTNGKRSVRNQWRRKTKSIPR